MNTITLFIIFVPILVLILLFVNLLLAVHRPDSEKVTPYECGFSPVYGQTRNPFSIAFYLVGILFLVFDIEILYAYPLAVSLYQTGSYGFWIFILFFGVLTIGFVYEFGSGALYFTDKRSSITNTDLTPRTQKTPTHLPYHAIRPGARYRFYSTKASSHKKKTSFYDIVFEKDSKAETENTHIIARRHIISGAPTTLAIINSLQAISITQTELDALISLQPTVVLSSLDREGIRDALRQLLGTGRSILPLQIRKAGVYI